MSANVGHKVARWDVGVPVHETVSVVLLCWRTEVPCIAPARFNEV